MEPKPSLAFAHDAALRRMRNWLVHHPTAELGQFADALGDLAQAPSWRELAAGLELLGYRAPGGAPGFLAEFVAHLAAVRGARTLLDPFATSPTLIAALAERLPASTAVALTQDDLVERLGRSVAPGVDWRLGAPFDALQRLDGRFEFIASTPPLGTRGGDFPVRAGLGDCANSLIVDAAVRLAPGGALAVLVSDQFFVRADGRRTQETLAKIGLRVEAAVSVEGGLRVQSEIPTSLLLVAHGKPLDELFVGRLDSTIDPAVLVEQMTERRPNGEFLERGVLYRARRYRGWRSLLDERELLISLGNVRYPVVELGDIALGAARLTGKEGEPANSVYVPEFPRAPVLVEPPKKLRGYARIDLDPERANARWVAAWFNEPVGQAARKALAVGATFERVRFHDLYRLKVGLPHVEDQAAAISVAQELELTAGEVAYTRAGLWTGDLSVATAQRFLDRLRGAFHDDPSKASAAPTVESWIELLPFPIAGVGRMYLAVQPVREKVDHLQHFFEAFAIFIATILFSAARRDAQAYEETIAKLRSGSRGRRSILDRADFHTWINVGRTVSKRIRDRLNADKSGEIRATLFGGLPGAFVEDLVAGAFWDALDAARLVRNERGHGGIEGERWLKGKLARLEASLNDLRLLAPHAFAGADLVRPGSAEQGDDDLFTFNRAERLMSSNMMFEEREVQSTASMRGRSLYLVPSGGVAGNPLQLLPLIQLRKVAETEDRAIYYYNRRLSPDEGGGFRFVSYHFGGRPEEQVVDSDLATLIQDLTPE